MRSSPCFILRGACLAWLACLVWGTCHAVATAQQPDSRPAVVVAQKPDKDSGKDSGKDPGKELDKASANQPVADPPWQAGVASVVITPETPMAMAGYASRTEPSDGKIHDLRAKALVLQDPGGNRLVIVTTDLIGIPRALRDSLEREVMRKHDLSPDALLLNASHTHCGPELRAEKASHYDLPPARVEQCRAYLERLHSQLLSVIDRAIADLAPAEIAYSHARAGFAMNRRLPTQEGVQNRPHPDGPVDHDVPVLRVDSPDGKQLRAVLFGYACHNTTLGFQKFCGDYAGFAQYDLEAAHPGLVALFMTGCGGDQNPQPRRTLELAEQHGRALANAVEAALISSARPIRGTLRTALESTDLEFAEVPTRDYLEKLVASGNVYDQRRGAALLRQLDQNGTLPKTYPYLVQVVQLGEQVTLIALAGEVVVDYSLRLKAELNGPAVWVAGYSNDVFAYIPSLRVLQEGGYEGGGAMRYTTLPGPWATTVERNIIDKVHALVAKVRVGSSKRSLTEAQRHGDSGK
jgi:neutral ceramidase